MTSRRPGLRDDLGDFVPSLVGAVLSTWGNRVLPWEHTEGNLGAVSARRLYRGAPSPFHGVFPFLIARTYLAMLDQVSDRYPAEYKLDAGEYVLVQQYYCIAFVVCVWCRYG